MNGKIIIGTEINTKGFDAQIDYIEGRLEEIDQMLSSPRDFGLTGSEMAKLNVEAEKLTNRLAQLKKQQAQINSQGLTQIGKSMSSIIKKVGKWALAVFGVRSAYLFVRQAMSTLTQYDKQLAADLEFIRYAVATTLAPIIKFIVQLVYKLLTAINVVWKRIFGVSLFAENLAQNFKNAKNQANGLKKTLAGFDEMNVLGQSGMTALGITPSFDPSKTDKDIDNWITKITKKLKELSGIVTRTLNGIFPNLNIGLIGTSLVNEFKSAWQIISGIFTGNYDKINAGIGTFVNNLGNKIKLLPSFFEFGILSQSGGVGIFSKFITYLGKEFAPNVKNIFKQLWNGIKEAGVGMWNGLKSAGKGFAKAMIDVINFLIDAINGFLSPFRAIIVGIGSIIGKKWTMKDVKIPHVKALAKGGIVNLPGKGVPVGGAIAGESGREAVLPLQDNQVLQEIADAIGRRITINANIVNSMNGRVLSREIQKIQNQSDFIMNR